MPEPRSIEISADARAVRAFRRRVVIFVAVMIVIFFLLPAIAIPANNVSLLTRLVPFLVVAALFTTAAWFGLRRPVRVAVTLSIDESQAIEIHSRGEPAFNSRSGNAKPDELIWLQSIRGDRAWLIGAAPRENIETSLPKLGVNGAFFPNLAEEMRSFLGDRMVMLDASGKLSAEDAGDE